MMGCAKVYYELKDAKYCIASVLDILRRISLCKLVMLICMKMRSKDYLKPICKDYIDYYNYNGWGTISAVDCNQMEGCGLGQGCDFVQSQDSLKGT